MSTALRHRELMRMLPRFYDDAPEVDAIMQANASEIERTRTNARDLLSQITAATATWGLTDWERVLELPPRPNSSVELRRARILAKLRGTQPATIANMLAIINAHVPQQNASIIELPEPGVIDVEIPLQKDIKMSELSFDVNTYKPAHLEFVIIIVAKLAEYNVELKTYNFEVLYPICNMFTTAEMPGVMTKVNAAVTQNVYNFESSYRVTNEFTTEGYEARTNIQNETTLKVEAYYVPYIRLGENELGDGLRLGGYVDDEETNQTRVLMSANSEDSTVTYKRTNEINLGEVEL